MIKQLRNDLKFMVESNTFGVCERLGEKLEMPAKDIRMFFIYASCVTVASPIVAYLTLAFVMKLRAYIRARRSPVWDF